MKRVDDLLSDYGAHHRRRGNLVCHAFGVTLIVFGILSLLSQLPVGPLTAAEIVIAAVVLYYATLDLPLAGAMLGGFILLDLAARAAGDWPIGLAAFAVGWVFQAVGHAIYEKNRPAFFKNLQHLLVGPLFLVNELLGVRRVAPLPR
ncbi:MAG TPA: Mpo1-like protein [Thermoanaerobaculia bacterium]|nr:Mpo1-like protein [Thermoanaerobaculia bacterium]